MKCKYLLLICTLLLCGCTNDTDSFDNSQMSVSQGTEESSTAGESSTTGGDAVQSPTYPQREMVPNEIVYYTADEAKEIIQSNTRFSIAEDFRCSAPKSISHFSSFTIGYHPRQDNASFYEDFRTMFAYLFPDETMYEDCLFYGGKNSRVEYDENDKLINTCKTVAEEYDRIMSGEEDVVYYFYSPHFDPDQTSEAENNIFMEFASPICSDLSNFNKGVLAEYYCKSKGKENDFFLETYNPYYFCSKVCTLPPDSEEAYTLLDGVSMSVADAVAFFENYINHLPLPEKPSLNIKVLWVDVLQCDTDTYCYYFKTTKAMDDIPFDWDPDATYYGGLDYTYEFSSGAMVVSDDVEQVYGVHRAQVVYDEVMHTEGINFATAMQKMDENLSAKVDFEVLSADFVYCSKAAEKHNVAVEDYLHPTTASWRVSLYNSNDGRIYICYVDALDGGNFHYYTCNATSE